MDEKITPLSLCSVVRLQVMIMHILYYCFFFPSDDESISYDQQIEQSINQTCISEHKNNTNIFIPPLSNNHIDKFKKAIGGACATSNFLHNIISRVVHILLQTQAFSSICFFMFYQMLAKHWKMYSFFRFDFSSSLNRNQISNLNRNLMEQIDVLT